MVGSQVLPTSAVQQRLGLIGSANHWLPCLPCLAAILVIRYCLLSQRGLRKKVLDVQYRLFAKYQSCEIWCCTDS